MLAVAATVLALLIGWAVMRLGVRGIAFKGLAGYRAARLLFLRMRGQTEQGLTEKRVVSGAAWDEFCDSLKAAGAALVHGSAPVDPFNQVGVWWW